MNILNMIREQMSPETLGQISKSLGESPEGTKSALEQAVPALLGSAASEAASPKGASDLFSSITRELPKLGSLSSMLGSLGSTGGGGPGSSFASSLLGPKMNMVRDFIAGRAGIGSGSGTSLLGIAGSLLMGTLGKQITTQKLDAGGFGQLLKSQVPHLQGMLPPELTKMLGLGNLIGTTQPTSQPSYSEPAYETAGHATAAAPSSGGKALKWALIPLALLVAGIFLYRQSRNTDMGGTSEQTYTATNRVTSIPYLDTSVTDPFKEALANPTGTPMDLRGVSFDSAGGLSSDTKAKLSALGQMINNHPSVKVTITAYGITEDDAAGKANAIKSALAAAGAPRDRISTETAVGEGLPKISFMK